MKEVNDKVIERIRKLLALSGSPNEAEAAAAMERAHKMLRDYNLEVADVAEAPEIGNEYIEEGGRQTKWRSLLLINIAKANYCAFIIEHHSKGYKYKLYGRPANVKGTTLMYEYLCEVIARETQRAAASDYRISSRAEYAQGMALRLGERVAAQAIEENTSCTALVPIATEAENFAREDCHPKNHTTTVKQSYEAMAGYAAGENISLARQLA